MQAVHKVRYQNHADNQSKNHSRKYSVNHSGAYSVSHSAIGHAGGRSGSRSKARSSTKTRDQVNADVFLRMFALILVSLTLLIAPLIVEKAMLEGNNARIDRVKTDIGNNSAIQQKKYIELNKLRAGSNIEALAATKYKMVRDYEQKVILYPSIYDTKPRDQAINLGVNPSTNYEYLTRSQSKTNTEPGVISRIFNGIAGIDIFMIKSSI